MVIEYEDLGDVPFMILEINKQIVVFINRALPREKQLLYIDKCRNILIRDK